MGQLSSLPNIGPEIERQLCAVGISTFEDLKKAGAAAAWLRIQSIDPSACIHRLMALEGAVLCVKKSELPPESKAELRAFYVAHKMR